MKNVAQMKSTRDEQISRLIRLGMIVAVAQSAMFFTPRVSDAQQVRRHTLKLTNGLPKSLGRVTFKVKAYSRNLGSFRVRSGRTARKTFRQKHSSTIFYIWAYNSRGRLIAANSYSTYATGTLHLTLKARIKNGYPYYYYVDRP